MIDGIYTAQDTRAHAPRPCTRLVLVTNVLGVPARISVKNMEGYGSFAMPLPDTIPGGVDEEESGYAKWETPDGQVVLRRVTMADYAKLREEQPALPITTESELTHTLVNAFFAGFNS